MLLPLLLNLEGVSAPAGVILRRRMLRQLARKFGFGYWYHYDR